MEKPKKKPNKTKSRLFRLYETVALMIIAVVGTFTLVSSLLAKYISSDEGSDNARVARFTFDMADKDASQTFVSLEKIKIPGDAAVYEFTVRNENETGVSDVAERYKFTAELYGSLPLNVTVTDATAPEGAEPVTVLQMSASGAVSTESDYVVFSAAVSAARFYQIKVEWPEDENAREYAAGGLAQLVLTIAAEQVN